ncbi:hypothetical protein GW17_00005412 [Ensete ventricosum]|nr:hypothetical protein GW17_00005412 [Ensete ventricosum]
MLSNRESARRSRMRKQKHMDDLKAQVSQLQKENSQILIALNITTQHYAGVEAENSLLRTQLMELSSRLQSLSEITYCMGGSSCNSLQTSDGFTAPWSSMAVKEERKDREERWEEAKEERSRFAKEEDKASQHSAENSEEGRKKTIKIGDRKDDDGMFITSNASNRGDRSAGAVWTP